MTEPEHCGETMELDSYDDDEGTYNYICGECGWHAHIEDDDEVWK